MFKYQFPSARRGVIMFAWYRGRRPFASNHAARLLGIGLIASACLMVVLPSELPAGPQEGFPSPLGRSGGFKQFADLSASNSSNSSSSLNESIGNAPAYSASVLPIPSISAAGSWPTYGQNGQRTDDNAIERTVSPGNASQLVQLWSRPYQTAAVVEGSMAVVNGTAYFGDYSGWVTALNVVTGTWLWRMDINGSRGNYSWTNCFTGGNLRGITSTPTVWNNTVYVPGNTGLLWALNASTGAKLWSYSLVNHTTASWTKFYIWGSPLIYNRMIYIGTASGCDNPLIQGQILAINTDLNSTYRIHAVRNTFTVVQSSDTGGSVWSALSVDPASNSIFATTGNLGVNQPSKWTNYNWTQAFLRLKASDICNANSTGNSTTGHCQTNGYLHESGSSQQDYDFGAGATVFRDDAGNLMVGAINKNGTFYAVYASQFKPDGTTPVAWQVKASTDATNAGHNIAPAAFDGSTIYLASSTTNLHNGTSCPGGAIRALNATTGHVTWDECLRGFVHAAVTYSDGVVIVASLWNTYNHVWNSTLDVLSAATGQVLWWRDFVNGTIDGEPVVSDGRILVPVGNFWYLCGNTSAGTYPCGPGYVYAYGIPLGTGTSSLKPATGVAFQPRAPAFGFGNLTGGMPGYLYNWSWGDGSFSSARNPSHYYLSKGRYVVNLTVEDAAGSEANFTWVVYAHVYFCSNQTFAWCSVTAVIPCYMNTLNCFLGQVQPVSFAGTLTQGLSGVTYAWTFGDGSPVSSVIAPTHTYAAHGTYTVTVTITNAEHHQSTEQFPVTV